MSQIIGRIYNPYAMPTASADIAGGLLKGMEVARQKGLAAGMQKVANGDESGWKDVAAVAPDVYLKHQNQEWERQHGNDNQRRNERRQ